MRFKVLAAVTLMSAAMTFGCKKTEEATGGAETATAASTTEIAGTSSPNDLNPVAAQSFIDDVSIGHAVGADGAIPAGQTGDNFVPGQTVHITMKINNAPAGTAVKVVYMGPGEKNVGEENKPVPAGATYLAFEKDTTGWPKGDYAADIYAGDEKVNTQHFNVVDAAAGQK